MLGCRAHPFPRSLPAGRHLWLSSPYSSTLAFPLATHSLARTLACPSHFPPSLCLPSLPQLLRASRLSLPIAFTSFAPVLARSLAPSLAVHSELVQYKSTSPFNNTHIIIDLYMFVTRVCLVELYVWPDNLKQTYTSCSSLQNTT
jgi:hypothetical protein